ncbi:hypothetical protein ACSX1A_00555 [Pontibacter sp. MBLB2868]|uniref:hypothetical protein n=1 Tax=Pontibacter sp. MBLB2868 TaxID=3451555 RepID=UPI003F74C76E
MKSQEIEFYIPTNVDVKEILKKEKKSVTYLQKQVDKYHWFLNALYLRSILNKKNDLGDFIPMNSQYMNKILGSRYSEDVKRYLLKHGIIETDRDSTIGIKSYGYRLTSAYQVRHYRILADSNTVFIQKLKASKVKAVSSMDDVTRYTYFHLNNLGIYRADAEQYVEQWYQQNYLVMNPKLLKRLKKKNQKRRRAESKAAKKGIVTQYPPFTYYEMLDIMRDNYLYQIRAIDEMLWLPVRDGKGRRIHTCLTNMWKELRQFLYLKTAHDTQIVSIDCSNSQPFTLVKIILEYFKGSNEMPDDVHHYIDLVRTGKLYYFMCQELGITDPEDIASFKTEMFSKVFYCETEKSLYTPEATTFLRFFPTVYQIIIAEKKYTDKLLIVRKDIYKQLSIEMQRVETKAVVDGVLTHLMNKYGGMVWANSIHDAMLIPSDYEAEVRGLMLQYYTTVVGITPHLKHAENVNVVKVAPANASMDELPDTTPLDELRQHFDAWFNSASYQDSIAPKQPEIDYRVSERKASIKRGIVW